MSAVTVRLEARIAFFCHRQKKVIDRGFCLLAKSSIWGKTRVFPQTLLAFLGARRYAPCCALCAQLPCFARCSGLCPDLAEALPLHSASLLKKAGRKLFKAIPHNYCRAITPANFSADCRKRRSNTDVFQGVFGKNDGKFASNRRQSPKGGNCAVLP